MNVWSFSLTEVIILILQGGLSRCETFQVLVGETCSSITTD